jgi:hypothetical protein
MLSVQIGEYISIRKVDMGSDLGVLLDSKLKFNQHVHLKIHKAYSILGVIKRNFKNSTMKAFVNLYRALVSPHLEYADTVSAPYRQMYIEEIEMVQMCATKLVVTIKNLAYRERLQKLNLPTLKYRCV